MSKGKVKNDISKQDFNYWHVIRFYDIVGNGNARFLCRCICGKEKVVRGYELKVGNSQSCGCQKKRATNKYHKQWSGCGDISGGFFSRIRYRDKQAGMIFDITVKDIWEKFQQQQGLCALTSRPIFFGSNNNKEHTASLDRIDPNKGYLLENVQWVHKDINLMRLDYSIDEFITMCYEVVNKHQSEIYHPVDLE